MALRQEPQRLRQPPRAPPGDNQWRRCEDPGYSDSSRAPRPAPVDGAAAPRLRGDSQHGENAGGLSSLLPAPAPARRAGRISPAAAI